MNHDRPLASLSLDLDNKWSYLRVHGDAGWEKFPSYLDHVVPRILDVLARRKLTITVFVVGQDAALPENRDALRAIADAGHEIGNHSFHHQPWLHLYSEDEIDRELALAEEHIVTATGQRPRGFRGPGFSFSPATLQVLMKRGYLYDASTLPTFLGPLARAYYFLKARLSDDQKKERGALFGTLREGLRPLRPYRWAAEGGDLLEIPVTTMPLFRVPFHLSYILYLNSFSGLAARSYFRTALALCRLTGVQPSVLLHPLDFLGGDDTADLSFFPAMNLGWQRKVACVEWALDTLAARFNVVSMREHAERLADQNLRRLRVGQPAAPVPDRAASEA